MPLDNVFPLNLEDNKMTGQIQLSTMSVYCLYRERWGGKRVLPSNPGSVQHGGGRVSVSMVMVLVCACFAHLFLTPPEVGASDSCPVEYRSCNWMCPSLPERCTGDRNFADPCGCCTVCMRQAGEMCSIPKRPCDAAFGLSCINGRCRGKMNLQVRSSTSTSVNLGWNPFLPSYGRRATRGHYVVYYTTDFSNNVEQWPGEIEARNDTYISIRGLTDGTDYYFRVSYRLPGRDGIRLEGPLSEVALHRTGTPAPLGGCEHGQEHYDEGMTIHQSCDSVCDCLLGSWICRPRGCPPVPDVRIVNPINCHEEPHPDDPECCTMIKCSEGPSDPFSQADCKENGVTYAHGDTFYRGCEEVCFCDNGVPDCAPRCPDPGDMIPDLQTCPHPILNEPPEGECCPQWACPPPPNSCELNGNTYEDGEYFDVVCSMRCQCREGSVLCVPRCPISFATATVDCPIPKKVQLPGECCMQWECEQPPAPGCMYHGPSGNITMEDGEWMDEGCESRCLCERGALTCMPMCAEPSPPSPTPLCPEPVVTKLRETDCCKVIACHDPKQDSPNVVQDVSVLAFNTTAVTVGFTPPLNSELVAITDGYIIYYTDRSEAVDLAQESWQTLRKDFPKGLKVRGHIMMEINGLLQETTYYLQIRVSIPDNIHTKLRWPNTLPSTDIFIVTTSENERQSCTFKDHVYEHGERFNDGCESACECRSGRTICREMCPKTDVIASDLCPNPRQVIVEGECCPEWRCFPNDGDCSHSNKIYQNGMEWREGCDVRCRCDEGIVSCRNVCNSTATQPRQECSFPAQVRVADTCCLEWVCYDAPPSTQFPTKSLPLPLSFFLVNISATNVSARSATIVWPALTDLQRQYIGQFRLKYRELTYGDMSWNSTVSFRPELRKYTILDFRPARSYVVQLVVMVGSTQVGIHLQTSKIEVDTLWLPSKPYPGDPFDIDIYAVTATTASIRWPALPNEIVQNIIGWRLMVVSQDESKVLESEIVERSALSYMIQNLTSGRTYHIQLLGLWDNETVTREVRSKTVPITTHSLSDPMEHGSSLTSPVAVIVGTVIALCIFLVVVVAFVFVRIRKRHSERYDVYGRNATINFRSSNYEHVYEGSHDNDDSHSERRFSDAGLLESGRRDSEAELLDID
ncbi:uncharacterized protein [Diadema antillarum]|uniref:uncharacterized protein isoform X1 n=1 Tax=Diadema antillarum TaxID=105358 RepID=UPI003A89C57D